MRTDSFPTWALLAAVLISTAALSPAQTPASSHPETQFANLCATCHGASANGTDRGPALVESRSLRGRSESEIRDIIHDGTQSGMPAFPLPEPQLQSLARWVHALNTSAFDLNPPGNPAAGRQFFFGKGNCGNCHMVAGRGSTNGPDLSAIGKQLTLPQIEQVLDQPGSTAAGKSSSGCPSWAWCPQGPYAVVNVQLTSGERLRGFARAEGPHDLQLQTFDGRFHLLREGEYEITSREDRSYMPPLEAGPAERRDLVAYLSRLGGIEPNQPAYNENLPTPEQIRAIHHPAQGDWPTYNGTLDANRHSPLDQINKDTVHRLQAAWSYTIPYLGIEMTPLVANGVMYISGPNQVCALDGRTGREIWCYTRPRSPASAISGDAAKGANRGVALLGDRIFFNTDDARLICLNRVTGALMWDILMPPTEGRYGATGAPLVAEDLVISGVGGGDGGVRGFLAAYKAATGELAWRFWTVPARGEAGSETWQGNAIDVGGAATWLSGSYDPASKVLYWATGNPFPDTDGAERGGDNLYTDCVLALDIATGKLLWYFQFTPHDLHDWDAQEPLVLLETDWQGRPRKLLVQANRNGFFYVLDRTTGQFLLGEPFVKKLTWASGIGPGGRPQLLPGNDPTPHGTKTCPAVRGATNWYSTAFNPATRLFYVMAVEDCGIYRQSQMGGFGRFKDPADPPEKYLRALDIETGKLVWEIPQVGPPEDNYSGVLSTAGGLLFYGETGGGFAAVDAASGKTLWHFETNQPWKASPMTYTANERQYVAIASGGNVMAFALPEH